MAAIGPLNVILAAEVVGYSSLIGAEENGTLERLQAHRDQFVYPKIAEHHGRMVRATGGTLLLEFASPTEAVRCAVEVQQGMIDRNIGTAPDQRIRFRVGVSIGEVTADGDDLVSRAVAALPIDTIATLVKPGTKIYRDGADIAVRVAALADPGGICISGTVRDAIRDQLPYTFEDMGNQNLDIRAAPMLCYALNADSLAARPRVAAQSQRSSASRHLRLRSAAGAAGVFATVGVWVVALWAWLGANSSTTPIPGPVTVGSQIPSISSTADRAGHEWPALKSPIVSSSAADTGSQASSAPQPAIAGNTAADISPQAASTRPTLPNIGTAVVRGKQAPSPPQTPPDTGTAAARGIQAPLPLETTPDSGTAVVRGKQGSSGLQIMPDIGTAVVRGNEAPWRLQIAPDSGTDLVRGARARSGPPFSIVSLPVEHLSTPPDQE
jgi:class 3 adenylate cyclase